MPLRTEHAPQEADLNEQIVSGLTSAVLAVDRDGVILKANGAAANHLNVDIEMLAPGTDLASIPGVQSLYALFQEMQREARPISRREIALITPEGQRTLGVTASLLRGAHAFNGAIFLFADLTRVRHLERIAELNRQLAQIGALTAGVVHELRNPLSVITGMTELLQRRLGPDNPLRSHADTVLQEAGHLDRLIGQFLHFAKPFELDLAERPAQEFLNRSLKLVERLAAERQVTIHSDLPKRLPVLQADATKLAQALSNILRNAIEISRAGQSVMLHVDVEGEELVMNVEDEGPGIHIQEGDNLFSPFFTKKDGGTGLGLSIVHRIITAHGGDVGYGNLPAGGAWFQVRLPLKRDGSEL